MGLSFFSAEPSDFTLRHPTCEITPPKGNLVPGTTMNLVPGTRILLSDYMNTYKRQTDFHFQCFALGSVVLHTIYIMKHVLVRILRTAEGCRANSLALQEVVFCRVRPERYPGYFPRNYPYFCTFCATSIPVHGTCVRSVRHWHNTRGTGMPL